VKRAGNGLALLPSAFEGTLEMRLVGKARVQGCFGNGGTVLEFMAAKATEPA
jgi:hypothetical protein